MREIPISILIDDGDRLDGALSNAYDYALYGLHLGVRCRPQVRLPERHALQQYLPRLQLKLKYTLLPSLML